VTAKNRPLRPVSVRALIGRIKKKLLADGAARPARRKKRKTGRGRVIGQAFDHVAMARALGLLSPEEDALLRLTEEKPT